jgi:thiamine-phosphate pyrophosphorylase
MARCYNASMLRRHPSLPDVWLVSDARNDARLEKVLRQLPRGSGLIFRHYHLVEGERRTRFHSLARIARQRGHVVVLAGTPVEARRWGAVGVYGAPDRLIGRCSLLSLVTAHTLRDIGLAKRLCADAVLLSPVFATRSHPGTPTLGLVRFRLLAQWAKMPVIALGGMDSRRALRLGWKKWAAIDGA